MDISYIPTPSFSNGYGAASNTEGLNRRAYDSVNDARASLG